MYGLDRDRFDIEHGPDPFAPEHAKIVERTPLRFIQRALGREHQDELVGGSGGVAEVGEPVQQAFRERVQPVPPAIERFDDLLPFGEQGRRTGERRAVLALDQIPDMARLLRGVAGRIRTLVKERDVDAAVPRAVTIDQVGGRGGGIEPLRDQLQRKAAAELDRARRASLNAL